MRIIKLDAIESTNSFLKDLSVNSTINNFTVAVAKEQTLGRGQMNTKWVSEKGKNLIFSVFVKHQKLHIINQTFLNFAISISIYEAIALLKPPKLTVKWPNDILSEKKKICGILIENSLKGMHIDSSVVGIGLNVNQLNFPENLPNASSLAKILHKEIDLDELLRVILEKLQMNIELLNTKQFEKLEDRYLSILFKKNVPSMFKDTQNVFFMGKIVGVNTQNGKLQIELNNETIKEFGLKEVSFV